MPGLAEDNKAESFPFSSTTSLDPSPLWTATLPHFPLKFHFQDESMSSAPNKGVLDIMHK